MSILLGLAAIGGCLDTDAQVKGGAAAGVNNRIEQIDRQYNQQQTKIDKLTAEISALRIQLGDLSVKVSASLATNTGFMSGGAIYVLVLALAIVGVLAALLLQRRGRRWRKAFEVLSRAVEDEHQAPEERQQDDPLRGVKERFATAATNLGIRALTDRNLQQRGLLHPSEP